MSGLVRRSIKQCMKHILIIAQLTFEEARRKRVAVAALVLGVAFVFVFALGFELVYREMQSEANRQNQSVMIVVASAQNAQLISVFTLAGLYASNFLGVMMSALLPVDTLAGEIRSGAIQTLLTKQVRREEVVLGKWLGFWVMLMFYMTLIVGGVVISVALIAGFLLPHLFLGIALMLLEATLILTVSIAGGTCLTTLTNGVTVFGLYGLAFVGGWVERIGSLFGNKAAEQVGIVTSLLMPSEALWQLAAYHMQPVLLAQLGLSPFSSASEPSPWMVVWAMGFIVATLAFALWQFERRDL